MKRKFNAVLVCILLLLSSVFLFVGCNQENNEDSGIVNPTTEEKIEGTWFAGREPLELPSSYLILTSSGKVYLSTDGVKYSTDYVYSVYSGNYYISENNYLFLELTHYRYRVTIHNSGSAFEVFNTDLESYNKYMVGGVKLVILEIKNNSLITIEEQPLRYTKMGG